MRGTVQFPQKSDKELIYSMCVLKQVYFRHNGIEDIQYFLNTKACPSPLSMKHTSNVFNTAYAIANPCQLCDVNSFQEV
jgi:hypothetical protein